MGDETKLPKWAQDEMSRLRRRADAAEARAKAEKRRGDTLLNDREALGRKIEASAAARTLVPPGTAQLGQKVRLVGDLHIVFDGPPGPKMGRFVEVETPDGRSVSVGSWHERPDGLWELRVSAHGAETPDFLEAGRQWMAEAFAGFVSDPPDCERHEGYLGALYVVAVELFGMDPGPEFTPPEPAKRPSHLRIVK